MSTRRFFPGWFVVAGSGVGIAFGSAVFISSSFALLAAAIGRQFGWSQTELAKAASIVLILQVVMYPVCGWALDRWGSRKVGSISIVGFGISLAMLSRIGNSLSHFYLAFVLIGLLGTGTNVISYARAITLWFDRKRGLALGLAAAAQAVGAFLMPIYIQKVIAASGWPTALLVLAGVEFIVCFPLVALLVKDSPRPYGLSPDGDGGIHAGPGTAMAGNVHELGGVVRSWTFWKLAIAFAIMGMSFYAWITNVTFILTKTAGMTLAAIATFQAIAGVAFLFGRLVFGYLLDKFHAPSMGVTTLVLAGIFYATLGTTASHAVIFVVVVLGGLSAGGESDLMPYVASRYFGTDAVSKLFGWFLCTYVVGAAIGPVAFAQLTAMFKGPTDPLYILTALQIIPIVLFLSLGPYREPAVPVPAAQTVS